MEFNWWEALDLSSNIEKQMLDIYRNDFKELGINAVIKGGWGRIGSIKHHVHYMTFENKNDLNLYKIAGKTYNSLYDGKSVFLRTNAYKKRK